MNDGYLLDEQSIKHIRELLRSPLPELPTGQRLFPRQIPANMQLLQTGGDDYPASSDNCNIYPATILTSLDFDDSDCTDSLTSDSGDSCYVYQIGTDYIPTDTQLLALKINGTDESGDKHFVAQYIAEPYASWMLFSLSGTLADTDASTTSFSVGTWGYGRHPDMSGTPVLNNLAVSGGGYLFSGSSGDIGIALLQSVGPATFQIVQMTCPS